NFFLMSSFGESGGGAKKENSIPQKKIAMMAICFFFMDRCNIRIGVTGILLVVLLANYRRN
ncbi:MAG: hypothetical protein ABIN89_20975, partial [Chitinophagaceae bacterium]